MNDNSRPAKWPLTGTATIVLVLGSVFLISGIFLALTASASAFVLIAMAIVVLGVGVAAETAGRSLRKSLRGDR